MDISHKKLGFIGGGNMAEAIFSGLIKSGTVSADKISATDVSSERLDFLNQRYGFATVANDPESNSGAAQLAKECDVIFLAVKPNVSRPVLEAIAPSLNSNKLVISIVGGLALSKIEEIIKTPAVRVMPNTTVTVLEGAAGMCAGNACNDGDIDIALEIFGALGRAFVIPEYLIDPLTGVSGCGPAYAYIFIEALADGGVKAGLPRELSYQLAAQTLLGSAKMVLETDIHPGTLKDNVCSPGGSTIAGVEWLEQNGFRGTVMGVVEAGVDRMKEIGKEM